MLSKLSANGTAGFVLANGSMSSNTSGEGEIRAQMIENDLIDCMIALPGQLFFTTQIPVCMWFISKSKKANPQYGYRDRRGETLFIDARNLGTMVSRTQKELTKEDIATIADTFHAWRSSESELKRRIEANEISVEQYQDQAGFCKVATLDEIKDNDFVLTPGRYVGAVDIEDDGIAFETKMHELTKTLYRQLDEAINLDQTIRSNMEALGYGE